VTDTARATHIRYRVRRCSEANTHTEVIASGSNAAVARAYGPPTENPYVAAWDMPRCARIARTSLAQSATIRPGCGTDIPWPGRS
jgi:hypothetical protein